MHIFWGLLKTTEDNPKDGKRQLKMTNLQSTTDQDLHTQRNNINKYIKGAVDSHKITSLTQIP